MMETRAESTKYRAVVTWNGSGEPITLTICDLSGAVPDPNVSPSSEAP